MKETNTLVINLYGGPGTGKSTVAAELFSRMKWAKKECELVTEFAKDLVWEERTKTLKNQIYIFGKQHNRIFRLLNKVDFIITDSPIILGRLYNEKNETHFPVLNDLILSEHNRINSINIFLNRTKSYNPNGRNQTESEAIEYSQEILNFLKSTITDLHIMDADEFTASKIMELIFNK